MELVLVNSMWKAKTVIDANQDFTICDKVIPRGVRSVLVIPKEQLEVQGNVKNNPETVLASHV